jgi:TPR repeat protein
VAADPPGPGVSGPAGDPAFDGDERAAVAWLMREPRTRLGGPGALEFALAMARLDGEGMERDGARALDLLRLAADRGSPEAASLLADLLHGGVFGAPDEAEAARRLRLRAAGLGQARLIHEMAMSLAAGRNGPPDELGAAGWFARLADPDVILARRSQLGLGLGLLEEGGPDRAGEAWRWIARAASLGDPEAAGMLASALEPGGALPGDASAAADWRRRAEAAGIRERHYQGAEAELAGQISGDPLWAADGARLHGEAAARGHPVSQLRLALGLLLDNRPEEAVLWLARAAESGLPDAQNLLGALHGAGQGVPRDPAEAARWYRLAAEAGLPDAQYRLGRALSEGDGVPRDEAEGAEWLRKAAEAGYPVPTLPGPGPAADPAGKPE